MCINYDIADLEHAVSVLRAGGVILYPTDTIWGIGCDATNSEAVARVYRIKEREDSKSMLVLVDSAERLSGYADSKDSYMILDKCSCNKVNKPTTVIYPSAHNLAQNLIAEDGSVGIRITDEVFSKELCRRLGKPIVSTSANISGEVTAKNYRQVNDNIRSRVDYICLYRREDEREHAPSRIVRIGKDGQITIIRE